MADSRFPWNDTPRNQTGPFLIDWNKRAINRRGTVVIVPLTSRAFASESEARAAFKLGSAYSATLRYKAETIDKLSR